MCFFIFLYSAFNGKDNDNLVKSPYIKEIKFFFFTYSLYKKCAKVKQQPPFGSFSSKSVIFRLKYYIFATDYPRVRVCIHK
jgi:hypothetical protein